MMLFCPCLYSSTNHNCITKSFFYWHSYCLSHFVTATFSTPCDVRFGSDDVAIAQVAPRHGKWYHYKIGASVHVLVRVCVCARETQLRFNGVVVVVVAVVRGTNRFIVFHLCRVSASIASTLCVLLAVHVCMYFVALQCHSD